MRPVAIVPPPWFPIDDDEPLPVIPLLQRWVRCSLVLIAVALVGVFALAAYLDPYQNDGSPRRDETHRQLGLPQCTFKKVTGLPCPSCGMTTSFSLLMHGDPVNSLRANAAGTLLALVCLLLIPWSLACAARGRVLVVRSAERTLTLAVLVFLLVMMLRWGVVVLAPLFY
jgi:hypothetical protein